MANEKKSVGGGHKPNKAAQKKRAEYKKGGNAVRNAVRRNVTAAGQGDPTALEYVRKSGSGKFTRALEVRHNAAIVNKVTKLAAAKVKADTPEYRALKAQKAVLRRERRKVRLEAIAAAKAGSDAACRFLISNYPEIATPDFVRECEKAEKAAKAAKKEASASAE